MPESLEDWLVEGDLVVRVEMLPEKLQDSTGAAWRERERNRKILEESEKK